MQNKQLIKRSVVVLVGLAVLVTVFSSWAAPPSVKEKQSGSKPLVKKQNKSQAKKSDSNSIGSDQDYELMKLFVDTFLQIEENYVHKVDKRKLIEGAIRGMLSDLDPYSDYIGPDELAFFSQQVEQEFGGIGIQVQIDPKTGRLMVMTPLPGTPAYKAGLRAGDLIMEIDGESTEGMSLTTAVKRLKGKPGEKVKLGILHQGAKELEHVTITRAIIHVPTVLGDKYNPDGTWDYMIDKKHKIAYVRLTHFGRHSAEELRAVLKKLLKQGMKGLILDLRFNPGGLLSQAVQIADMFISEGTIVSTEGRSSPKRVWTAHKQGTLPPFPMAVLVNHFSASASEIVSACLQDHKRAVIVGERTWGKGSVQSVVELEGGKSALKLTTAKYMRPSGKNIHRFKGAKESDEWGVKPDPGFEVKLKSEELRKLVEYRRERDVLRPGHQPPKSDFVDRQLQKALEYIWTQLKVKPSKTAYQDKNKPQLDKGSPKPKKEARKTQANKAQNGKNKDKNESKKQNDKKKNEKRKDSNAS